MFRRKKKRRFLYILFCASLIFVIHKFFISFSNIKKYSCSAVLYPVLLSQKHIIIPIKKFFEKRKTNQELQKLVFKLNTEKENLVSDNIQLRASLSFYDQIREVIEFKERYNSDKIRLCQVIFKHINKNSHFFLINKGSSHGVKNDMVAIYNNFLLGRVSEAYPFYSKVLLVTDKSCKVAAYCNKTKANGIHVGNNSLENTLLTRVSHFDKVHMGDFVFSSGYGLVFPQGFALGKISDIQKDKLYHTIEVEPLFKIKDIDYCLLIKKGDF